MTRKIGSRRSTKKGVFTALKNVLKKEKNHNIVGEINTKRKGKEIFEKNEIEKTKTTESFTGGIRKKTQKN